MPADSLPIQLRLLGPVDVLLDGEDLPVGGRRQRTLLSLLALEPGRPVAGDWLIDELWSGEPPDGADITLRSYVSRLRASVGPAIPIQATDRGYSLHLDREHIDRPRFERLIRQAEVDVGRRNHRRALARLREALDLWRGRPFAGLATDGVLAAEAERLEELRLRALELRFEANLELGAAAELVDELEGLVRTHPYREPFWRQLMLALYRADRQADALGAFHRARSLLDSQLGLDPGEGLRALEAAILRREVPEPAVSAIRHNLPEPLTSFIGRSTEIEAVRRRIGEARIVTLTGMGGVGKTRLALEVARQELPNWPDGVVFVDLSALVEPRQLARHVTGVVGLGEQPGVDEPATLIGHLRDRELLLVLDNCEHVLDAAGALAQEVLSSCGRVGILATSRELLGCVGEADVPIQPLQLPDGDTSVDELRASDAIALFLARASEARHGLVADDAAVQRAADICRDLEGLPLAIELAAARARSFSLDEIAIRLRERFRFLVSWRRLTQARHRTLRQAIDWSFDLLVAPEQQLLGRLSVFSGGATLEAIAVVCLEADDDAAITLIDRLVASSLVNAVHGEAETRYRMLETVRHYAAEHLAAADDAAAIRQRHARYFRSLVDAAWAPIRLTDTAAWTARLANESDNLRAALAWARATGDDMELLRLAEGLWYFWWIHGDVKEGRAWLAQALERGSGADPLLYARALGGAARLAWAATDFEAAIGLAERAYASLPPEAAALDRGSALQTLGVISTARGDLSAARSWLEQAGLAFESLPPEDPWRRDRLAGIHVVLGSVHFFEGDYAAAVARYREALADCIARNDQDGIALCELYIGHVDLVEARVEEGLALVRSSFRHYHRLGWPQYVAECLELIAYGLLAQRRAVAATRLYAAAEVVREQSSNPATHAMAEHRDEALPALRAELGDVAFDAELAAGRAMRPEEVLSEALGA